MSEDFNKLKTIGAQKIYEKTHIARANVEKILSKSFDEIPKIQFRGFVSILEREYHLDLKDLLDEYELIRPKEKDDIEFVLDERDETKSNKKIIFAVLVVSILIGTFVISKILSSDVDKMELTHAQIDAAQQYIDTNTTANAENNLTADVNMSAPIVQEVPAVTKPTKFEILTNRPLWIGYVDMDSNKKQQITISNNKDFDIAKNYLVELGHGVMKVDLGIEVKEYKSEAKQYFEFKDGEFTELTKSEFKKLNKGSTW